MEGAAPGTCSHPLGPHPDSALAVLQPRGGSRSACLGSAQCRSAVREVGPEGLETHWPLVPALRPFRTLGLCLGDNFLALPRGLAPEG